MKRYTAILLSCLLTTSVLFTGCSNKQEENKDQNKTTIKFATFYSEKEQGSVYKELIEQYEKNNPDIKVELVSDYGEDDKVKETVTQKGDMDIIGLKRNQIIEFAKSGQIEDLSDLVQKNELDKKLYKISTAYGKYNGKVYGIGDMPMTIEWFYNSDMFDKYNLQQPRNASELSSLCSKIKSKGIIPIGVGAMDGWHLSILLGMITAQTAGSSPFTSSYGSDSKTYQNIPGIKDAFNIFGKMTTSCIPQSSSDINYRQSIDDFVKGKSAILPTGSWATELIDEVKPNGFHYKAFEMPVSFVENPVTSFSATAGQIIAIPSNSKNKKDAEKFLEYLYSEEAQKLIVKKGSSSSLISANQGDTSIKKLISSHLEMADENSILIYDNLEPKMAENMTRILQDILEGRVKASEGWSRIIKLTFQQ